MHKLHEPSKIVLNQIKLAGTKVSYEFTTYGEIRKAFNHDVQLEIDYHRDISEVPYSIAVIPFVANILPIVWIYDAELIIEEIDQDFFLNIDSIKNGYVNMYPKLSFGGSVKAGKLISNHLKSINGKESILLFSGGVDATSSLITLLKSKVKPRLVTLWGADVLLEDEAGWLEKSEHTKSVAELFNLKTDFVKTTFRSFINAPVLDAKIERLAGDKWWHGFQHGIGIICHTAPLAYLDNVTTTYIAASFTKGEVQTCASDPTIDENVHLADGVTVHEGYEMSRQDKIRNIHEYVTKKDISTLPIKVCWKSMGAKNCGRCEKCMRTASGFLAENSNLSVYDLGSFDSGYAEKYIIDVHYFRHTLQWARVQERIRENINNISEGNIKQIEWILNVDFEKVNDKFSKRVLHLLITVKGKVTRLIPKGVKTWIKNFKSIEKS